MDCIARAEGKGNASTDECNDLSIPCNKLFVIIEVCVEHLFSTNNVILQREAIVTLTCTCRFLEIISVQIIVSKCSFHLLVYSLSTVLQANSDTDL